MVDALFAIVAGKEIATELNDPVEEPVLLKVLLANDDVSLAVVEAEMMAVAIFDVWPLAVEDVKLADVVEARELGALPT